LVEGENMPVTGEANVPLGSGLPDSVTATSLSLLVETGLMHEVMGFGAPWIGVSKELEVSGLGPDNLDILEKHGLRYVPGDGTEEMPDRLERIDPEAYEAELAAEDRACADAARRDSRIEELLPALMGMIPKLDNEAQQRVIEGMGEWIANPRNRASGNDPWKFGRFMTALTKSVALAAGDEDPTTGKTELYYGE
jgi:hypothetical protein